MRRFHTWSIPPGSLEYPLVIAHRGAAGLAPENTMSAFHTALEVGADAIELDVRLTRDGRVVVLHDRRLERTTSGRGPVGAHTLQELKALDAGSWFGAGFRDERVPTLEEVFEAMPGEFPIYVEMKARGYGARALAIKVVDITRRFNRRDHTLVASFNPLALAILRAVDPRIFRGYIWSRKHPLPLRARWLSPMAKPHWLAPDRGSITPESLAKFHAQGKPVAAWDLDTGTDMVRLREIGLDAVVTDHPDVLAREKSGLI